MNLSYRIKTSPNTVFDYLTDMQKFVSIHPVITKIENVKDNNYKIYETLKFGFIPCSFTYTATVESDRTNGDVILKATVMKFNKVEMKFHVFQDGECTVIEEEITFKVKMPVKSMLGKIFKKQHQELFANLEKVVK